MGFLVWWRFLVVGGFWGGLGRFVCLFFVLLGFGVLRLVFCVVIVLGFGGFLGGVFFCWWVFVFFLLSGFVQPLKIPENWCCGQTVTMSLVNTMYCEFCDFRHLELFTSGTEHRLTRLPSFMPISHVSLSVQEASAWDKL